MTTSGLYTFSPEVAELVDEAAERARIDPESLGGRFIRSARRSLNYLFRSWEGEGLHLWTIADQSFTPVQGATTVLLAAGSLEVLEAGVRDSVGTQTPMDIIGRQEYFEIPTKTTQGRPDRIWPERRVTTAGPVTTGYFWQAQGTTAYTIVLKVLNSIHDVGAAHNTLQLPPSWLDAAADGLAARLARKFNPAALTEATANYLNSMRIARRTNRDTGDTVIEVAYDRRW